MPSLLIDRRNNLNMRLRGDNLLNVHALRVDMEVGGHRASGDTSIRIEEDGNATGLCEKGSCLFLGVARGRVVVDFLEIVEDLGTWSAHCPS